MSKAKDQTVNRLILVPIADQVAEFLRNRIRFGTYRPGYRLPGELALAEEFQVSRGTVRSALTQLEKQDLIRKKQGKGTFVHSRRRAAGHQRPAIAFVVWDDWTFFPEVIRGASLEAQDSGYSVIASFTGIEGQHQEDALKRVLEEGVAGVLLATHPLSAKNRRKFDHHGPPFVLVDMLPEDTSTLPDYVVTDNFGAARLAVEHLYALGHRSMLHITHDVTEDIPCRSERIRGFQETCKRLGLDRATSAVLSVPYTPWDTEEAPAWADRHFLRASPWTACICFNDELAAHVLKVAQKLDVKVPEELSIVGFDNSATARAAAVPITSVGWDLVWMGRFAARMLIERIEGPPGAPHRGTVVSATLETRRSTGPPGRQEKLGGSRQERTEEIVRKRRGTRKEAKTFPSRDLTARLGRVSG